MKPRLKMVSAGVFANALRLWLLGLLVISGYDAKVSAHIASAGQDANAATMRKARALVEYLEKTKDKRVEKVVVNKFGFSGAPKEEYVNYTVKIGDIKYQVGRPGKDQKGANYVAFDVWAGKTTQLTVTDEGIDGSVDAGMDVKAATKEEKKVYGTKAYVLSDRERWQAEYEKFLDAVIGHLGIVVP